MLALKLDPLLQEIYISTDSYKKENNVDVLLTFQQCPSSVLFKLLLSYLTRKI